MNLFHSELLAVKDTANYLQLKESTIRAWILKRRIPLVRLGRRVFIRHGDCDQMITANLILPPQRQAQQEAR